MEVPLTAVLKVHPLLMDNVAAIATEQLKFTFSPLLSLKSFSMLKLVNSIYSPNSNVFRLPNVPNTQIV